MDMKSRQQEYYIARGAAKRAIFKVKDTERKKFCEDLEGEDGTGNVFRRIRNCGWLLLIWRKHLRGCLGHHCLSIISCNNSYFNQ